MYLTEMNLRKIEDDTISLHKIQENNPIFGPEYPPVELSYDVGHCRVFIRIFSIEAELFIQLANIEHRDLTRGIKNQGDIKPYTQKLFAFLKEECLRLMETEPRVRLRYYTGQYQMTVAALQYG